MSRFAGKKVVVFGSSQPVPGSAAYETAYALGKALAEAGYVLVNGGYGGTMAAAAQGAKVAQGQTIGVTCAAFKRSGANPFVDREIETPNLARRIDRLIELGDAFVVLPGSTGTLVELAVCWELMNKRFIPGRPMIYLNDFWRATVQTILDTGECEGGCVHFADDVPEVVRLLTELI